MIIIHYNLPSPLAFSSLSNNPSKKNPEFNPIQVFINTQKYSPSFISKYFLSPIKIQFHFQISLRQSNKHNLSKQERRKAATFSFPPRPPKLIRWSKSLSRDLRSPTTPATAAGRGEEVPHPHPCHSSSLTAAVSGSGPDSDVMQKERRPREDPTRKRSVLRNVLALGEEARQQRDANTRAGLAIIAGVY